MKIYQRYAICSKGLSESNYFICKDIAKANFEVVLLMFYTI